MKINFKKDFKKIGKKNDKIYLSSKEQFMNGLGKSFLIDSLIFQWNKSL